MKYPPLECRADLLKMFDEMTAARQTILDQCARLTGEQLLDPVIPGSWPVLQVLAHLAWAEEYMLAWVRKRPAVLPKEEWPAEPPAELAALRTALDEAHAAAIVFLKANRESVLREPCQYGRHGEQTVGGVLFHLVEHEIHHRAFLKFKLERLVGQ